MLDQIHTSLMSINNSSYFAGILMLIVNIGSKYISIELSKTQEQYVKHKIGRQILIFSIIWLGIKDIYKSLILTAVFVLLADHLFNEKSNLCILPKQMRMIQSAMDLNDDNNVSDEEVSKALHILENAKKKFKKTQRMTAINNFMI